MITRPLVWGVIVGGLVAWWFSGRCPSCGTPWRSAIDPGAILAHGA